MRTSLLIALACAALLPATSFAQPSADVDSNGAITVGSATADGGEQARPPQSQGPMIVERLHSGWVITPEAKVTRFDRKTSGLVGATGGYLKDEVFFIGGAGYWMPERRGNDRQLAYGGVVLQWFFVNSDRGGISARVLLGGGRATLPETVTEVVGLPDPRTLARLTPAEVNNLIRQHTVVRTVGFQQDFGLAEPEVNGHIRLGGPVSLTVGAGYRFAGSEWRSINRTSDDNRRLSGAVGTIGLQIGGNP